MSRQLLKDSTIYGIGALLSNSLGFLLIPLYTRYLDVADYGRLTLLNQVLQVIGFLFLVGISTASMRFFYDADADDAHREKVYGTAALLLLVIPPLMFVPAASLTWFLSDRFLPSIPFVPYLLIVLITGLFTPLEKLVKGLLRVQRRPIAYISFDLAFFLTQALSIIIAVAWLGLGLRGQLYAQLLANVVFSLASYVIIRGFCRPTWSERMASRMLKFGAPLIPFFILAWVNVAAGRFLLERFAGLDEVGLFALSSQFAGLLLLASTAFDNAFMPHFLQRAGNEGAESELGLLVTRYVAMFGLVGIGVVAFAPTAIFIMAKPAYREAADYVAPLTLASWLFAVRRPLIWCFTHNQQSTALSVVQSGTVAALLLLLALFLGPLGLGIMGVAYASILSNLIFLVVAFAVTRSGFHLHIPWPRLAGILALLATAGALLQVVGRGQALNPTAIALQAGIFVAAAFLTARAAGINSLTRLLRPAP